jgi:Mce-associated membrane protein
VTNPQSGSADDRLCEPEKESAAVRSESNTTTDPADTGTGATEPFDGEDVTDSADTPGGEPEADNDADDAEPAKARRRIRWSQVLVYAVLPGLALLLAIAAGFLKWQDVSARSSQIARIEAVAAAKDAAVAILSYKPDSAEKELDAARERLTGTFKESYTQLAHDVVIPGAKEKHVSSVATVPAAASVSATPDHAVVVLFVNQNTVVGTDAPTDSESIVRVSLDKIDRRWLVSNFEPI